VLVVLVYLERLWRNSLLKSVLQPEIAKKIPQNPIFTTVPLRTVWEWEREGMGVE